MKFNKKIISVLLVSLFLTACAAGPGFKEYTSKMPSLGANQGRIYIYRKTSFGAAVQPAVRVNGKMVGKAVPRGFFYIDRPAGSYTISASTEAKRSLSLKLNAGDVRYVRLEVKIGLLVGHIKPVLVDNSVGKQEIAKTKYNIKN